MRRMKYNISRYFNYLRALRDLAWIQIQAIHVDFFRQTLHLHKPTTSNQVMVNKIKSLN